MAGFIETYGGNLQTMAHSGLGSVLAAEKAGLTIGQIQDIGRKEGITFGPAAQDYFTQKNSFTTQLTDLKTSFTDMLTTQATQFKERQEEYDRRLREMQQKMLEAQTRQASQQQMAQVAAPGGSMVIRGGSSTRFSRPELQIKSMNI